MNEAFEQCQKSGRSVHVLEAIDAKPPYVLGNFPKTEIRFKCVSQANESRSRHISSTGTGFVISKGGHILTNNHVVDECQTLVASKGNRPRQDHYKS